jgi:hypothetical protein
VVIKQFPNSYPNYIQIHKLFFPLLPGYYSLLSFANISSPIALKNMGTNEKTPPTPSGPKNPCTSGIEDNAYRKNEKRNAMIPSVKFDFSIR